MGSVLTKMWRRLRSTWPWWRWTLSRRNAVDGASQQDVRVVVGAEVIAGAEATLGRMDELEDCGAADAGSADVDTVEAGGAYEEQPEVSVDPVEGTPRDQEGGATETVDDVGDGRRRTDRRNGTTLAGVKSGSNVDGLGGGSLRNGEAPGGSKSKRCAKTGGMGVHQDGRASRVRELCAAKTRGRGRWR